MSKTRQTQVNNEALAFPTLQAAARSAGLTRQTLVKHLDEIPHRKVGRRIIISKRALQRWLEGHNDGQTA